MNKCFENKHLVEGFGSPKHRRQFSIIDQDQVHTAIQQIKTENAEPTPPPSPKLCQAQRTLVAQQKQIIFGEQSNQEKS